jgi:hypothetical protein
MHAIAQTLSLWKNPLVIKGVRTRLRLRHALSRGIITFVVAAFFFLIVYLGGTERNVLEPGSAAKVTLVPLLFLQGFILMLLGTGSVASGIALERDSGVLDFHRMTPLPVAQKLIGYLFGLPAREYFMFGVTVPFVVLAVVIGRLPVLKVLHLYVVFFSTVWLYHLTGLMAGMIAPKPRRASWIAQAIIIALHLLLPTLSNLGFTFFGYFTILPAFRAIVAEELGMPEHELKDMAMMYGLVEGRYVQFFAWSIHPTLYTLCLQGFLSASWFIVSTRKWRQETRHAFSKWHAVIIYAVMQFLLAGSLWPFLTSSRNLEGMSRWLQGLPELKILLYFFFLISVGAAVVLLHIVTPSRFAQLKGIQRARKSGHGRVPLGHDAASSAWVAAAFAALACASYAALVHLIRGRGPSEGPPTVTGAAWPAVVVLTGLIAYVQAAREAWDKRAFVLFLFLLWLVPTFVFLIAAAAWNPSVAAAYLSIPSPFTAFWYAADALMPPAPGPLTGPATGAINSNDLVRVALAINAVLAIGITLLRLRGARALRRFADASPVPMNVATEK